MGAAIARRLKPFSFTLCRSANALYIRHQSHQRLPSALKGGIDALKQVDLQPRRIYDLQLNFNFK
jgi:hypothetical protein